MNNYEIVKDSLLVMLDGVKKKYFLDKVDKLGGFFKKAVYGLATAWTGIDVKCLFDNIREQAKLTVIGAYLIKSKDFELSYIPNDYLNNLKAVEYFRKNCSIEQKDNEFLCNGKLIPDIKSALKCYCGLDEVLWMSKNKPNFVNVLSQVIELYRSQVVLAKTLVDSKGEDIKDLIYNAFINDPDSKIKMQKIFDESMQLRYELYQYLKVNHIIDQDKQNIFNSATLSMQVELSNIVESAFRSEITSPRKQIIESTI